MNDRLQKVAEMIKKTFHKKEQTDCFEGCVLFVEEMCSEKMSFCIKGINKKLEKLDRLVVIEQKIDSLALDFDKFKTEMGYKQ